MGNVDLQSWLCTVEYRIGILYPNAIMVMLLYTYFQKTRNVSRREYDALLQSKAIAKNNDIVGSFDEQVAIWDLIQINLPDDTIETEKVEYMPWFSPKIVLFHKPLWCVCSKDDPHNRIIYEYLPKSRHKDFWYIWRLDKESTGLLLLTNESKLVDYYENPFHDVHKVYEVTLSTPLRTKDIKKMKTGQYVTRDGELSTEDEMKKTVDTELLKCVAVSSRIINGTNKVIITLNEWKYRHIRRLLSSLWYKVKALKRIKVWKRHIWSIKPGRWKIEKATWVNASIKNDEKKNAAPYKKKKKKQSKKKLWKRAKRAKKVK